MRVVLRGIIRVIGSNLLARATGAVPLTLRLAAIIFTSALFLVVGAPRANAVAPPRSLAASVPAKSQHPVAPAEEPTVPKPRSLNASRPGGRVKPKPIAVQSEAAQAGAGAGPADNLSAAATPTPVSIRVSESTATLDFLGQTIDWYHGLDAEQHLAAQPVGLLYLADDRRLGLQVVQLAFQYARARAELISAEAQQRQLTRSAGKASGALPGLAALMARYAQVENDLHRAQAHADQLRAAAASARDRKRIELKRQLGIVQSQVQLDQARVDSFKSFIDFDKAATLGGSKPTGLVPQIDALERSIPQLDETQKGAGSRVAARPAAAVALSDQGLLGAIEGMFRLGRESDALQDRTSATRSFIAVVEAARAPLVTQLRALNRRASELAARGGTGDLATVQQRKREFDTLIKRHKLIIGALMPLAKQAVVLQLYVRNLDRWGTVVNDRTSAQLRNLIIQLSVLAFLLIALFVGSMVWRRLTFSYVQEPRRRRQLLQLRKLTVASLVLLVFVIEFASELGALATVMGFAAAGIAFALQNVILSFAGYFFITGRYGIRVGDRIELAGVKGDVVEVGLFKMALMELAGGEGMNQLTGRVVVFTNSIIFQPNGNFFRPAPGTNFMWNEFRLTLAPECDYRSAEKRLLAVVEDAYARYRDSVQRQYRQLEHGLNLKMESPHPQSRLRLSQSGIEMTIRYPTDTSHAIELSDEISRRVLDTIDKDSSLTLIMPGTANLQPATASRSEAASVSVAPDGHEPAAATTAPAATAAPTPVKR